MKKMISLLLAFLMTLSLAACASQSAAEGSAAPAEEDGQNPVMNFVGVYSADRASILVEAKDADQAKFTVTWGGSAWEQSEWTMSGKLDTEKLTVDYTDCVRKDVVYADDGSVESETVVYENGAGTITFSTEDYSLTWNDSQEHIADGMTFTGGTLDAAVTADYSGVTAMDPAEVEAFAREMKEAYLKADWAAIANHVRYPVNVNGETIVDEAALLAALEGKGISASARAEMEDEDCAELFCNGQGICLGTGQLWLLDPNYMTDEIPVLQVITISGVE